jgi:ferredoxin--NADP+ reductase
MTLALEHQPDFKPGQFFNFGLFLTAGYVSRSYSAASAPGARLEFLIARVPGPGLTPALFELAAGDAVSIDPRPQGFFTLDFVPPHRELWLLGTGTGLGPFLSMLRSGVAFDRAERVILVHGARTAREQPHKDELEALEAREPARFRFISVLSREPAPGALSGRITSALASGALETRAAQPVVAATCHAMLCGNPQMIEDVTALLAARGLKRHRQRAPGQITTEKYW